MKPTSGRNIAIVGLGRIGIQMELDEKRLKPATHFGAYYNHPDVAEIYLCDSNPEQREKAVEGVSASVLGNKFLLESKFDFIELKERLRLENAKNSDEDTQSKPKHINITFAASDNE